jgi:hypothetical protein
VQVYKRIMRQALDIVTFLMTVDGVLDWQPDLLHQAQLHTITVYSIYNSQQLSLNRLGS